MIFATVHLTLPWEGHAAPSASYHGIHPDAYFQAVFSNIGEQLLSLVTENLPWLVFGIAVFLAMAVGNKLWSMFHPGDVIGRARDAQYAAEVSEVGNGEHLSS